ncbi:CLUMA_CG016211, isoform A [Clunio marinus]|uniref:ATP-dependent RNA helicase n=1 Tax=Clunio marinus TaxID=568069 RepID=A0A1J1IVJ1_9DIPT|nr:CLUMA_CG016211, isoform A [Clunio marinus]
MELLLNVTTSNGNPNKEKKDEKNKIHYAGSGFSFEFTNEEKPKATVLARKRPSKKLEENPAVDFKLSSTIDELKEENKKPHGKIKKKISEPTAILNEILERDSKHDLPKQLPTVDFMDEPVKFKKGKAKGNDNDDKHTKIVDFAKKLANYNPASFASHQQNKQANNQNSLPPPKRQKPKFSKVSNPFPNDPSKKVANKEKQQKSPTKEQKPSISEKPGTCSSSSNSNVFASESVDSLKIHPFAIRNMKDLLKFHQLTHVQQKAIPPALEGKDLLIRSPTGSGKTLSYALPIVEKLHKMEPKLTRGDGIHAIVIVPTRELAVQTYELFMKLVRPFRWLVPGYLSGGEKRKAEKARLRNGINILISTPGRICDHLLHTESMKLDKIQIFALDEADRLLELGYENDVKKVVDTISEQNKDSRNIQKILLSATLTSKVKKLAGLTLTDPVYVDNDSVDVINDSMMNTESDDNIVIPSGIEQKYFMLPPKLRFIVLCSLIVQQINRGAKKIVIFFPTQHVVDFNYDIMVEFLTQPFTRKEKTAKSYLNDNDDDIDGMLEEQEEDEDEDEGNIWVPNVTFFKLFGSMTQIERVSVFREFKAVKAGVLLCTDVAARGLDVPQVDLVIQYSAPQELNNYYHRIGRTARAGNKGEALIFLNRNEEKFVELLKEKNVEINEEDYHKCLKEARLPNMNIKFFEERIVTLQRKLENLLNDDNELRMKASKAFTSWICYYKTFSKELRHIFNLREMHMGHIANNFGLRDAPKSIVKQHSTADDVKKERNKNFDFDHRVHVPRGDQRSINKLKRKYGDFSRTNFSKSSTISEFDSGLPEVNKKVRTK